MANRYERQARETASAEGNRRARTQGTPDHTVHSRELSREELQCLVRSRFHWEALPGAVKSYKIQRICRVFQTIHRDQQIIWGFAYEDTFDCCCDLLRFKMGRKLLIDFGGQITGLLRGGYSPVRRLNDWDPPQVFRFEEVLHSLCIEWFGAYKGRMKTFAIKPFPKLGDPSPVRGKDAGNYHLRNQLQQGRSIGAWPVSKAFHDPEKASAVFRALPPQMRFPKVVTLFARLRAQGVKPGHVMQMIRYHSRMTQYVLNAGSVFWHLLTAFPRLDRSTLIQWLRMTFVLWTTAREMGIRPNPHQELEIIRYSLSLLGAESGIDPTHWFSFCLYEVATKGKYFGLTNRNQQQLWQRFHKYQEDRFGY